MLIIVRIAKGTNKDDVLKIFDDAGISYIA